jgi:molybdate transport system substrate-binding protein
MSNLYPAIITFSSLSQPEFLAWKHSLSGNIRYLVKQSSNGGSTPMSKSLPRMAGPGIALVVLSLFSLLLAACGDTTPPTIPPPTAAATTPATISGGTVSGEVIVFAASSLTDPFNRIKADLEKANPGLKVTYNFGGSNTLQAQLEQGAKADVFASANQTEMNNALKGELVAGKGVVFAQNRLVVILPANNPGKIRKLQDLAKPGLKIVTTQKDVPVGGYTLQALDKMSQDPAFSPDFAAKVRANFVSQESNVKQVVAKVQLGEADAGVCYLTDISALLRPDLTTLEIPDRFNTLADYPIAPLKAAPNPAAARLFIAYLLGPQGQATLKSYNFISPGAATGSAKGGPVASFTSVSL